MMTMSMRLKTKTQHIGQGCRWAWPTTSGSWTPRTRLGHWKSPPSHQWDVFQHWSPVVRSHYAHSMWTRWSMRRSGKHLASGYTAYISSQHIQLRLVSFQRPVAVSVGGFLVPQDWDVHGGHRLSYGVVGIRHGKAWWYITFCISWRIISHARLYQSRWCTMEMSSSQQSRREHAQCTIVEGAEYQVWYRDPDTVIRIC